MTKTIHERFGQFKTIVFIGQQETQWCNLIFCKRLILFLMGLQKRSQGSHKYYGTKCTSGAFLNWEFSWPFLLIGKFHQGVILSIASYQKRFCFANWEFSRHYSCLSIGNFIRPQVNGNYLVPVYHRGSEKSKCVLCLALLRIVDFRKYSESQQCMGAHLGVRFLKFLAAILATWL